MLISNHTNAFRDHVQGTWGTFTTPAGRVDYILTKARLGEESLDPERLLTKSLRPVREVMSAGDLDFNQLLQRDLDDHRVATSLVEYLLKPRATGPAFFPPIVAVLLPFRNKQPSLFPDFQPEKQVDADGMRWLESQAGDAFQVRRLIDESGKFHSVNIAQLRWNSTAAQIVVLDGQHRAMALLAVDRTMSRTWQDNEGSKYRSFYERQVQQYLQEYGSGGNLDLSKVEVPVAVCWFPDKTGAAAQPHEAARKLFVDVNKEARPPSESRIILLSDAELVNVLTRSLLSSLRASQDGTLLPLYAVEYDNPDVNNSRPARWSVMTNINLLKMAVNRCVFGPQKYLQDVAQKFGGRESKAERDAFMRKQLDVKSIFPAEIEDGGLTYRRDAIGDENFPIGQIEAISNRFSETWGKAILTLLSHVAPYAAHTRALIRMENDWSSAIEPFASLARDALFGGVGVYWTLKDSHEHFREEVRAGKPRTMRSRTDDVIQAWNLIEQKKSDFEVLRAGEYLGSTKSGNILASKDAFDVLNTHACQLGLVMTLGSLWELRKLRIPDWSIDELPAFAEAVVSGCNAYMDGTDGSTRAHDRRLAFSKSSRDSINKIGNMDTPRAIYFRYFWLESLATAEGWPHISSWFDGREGFDEMVGTARRSYREYCVSEQVKILKSSSANQSSSTIHAKAENSADKALRRSLEKWFGMDGESYRIWQGAQSSHLAEAAESAQPDLGDGDVEDPTAVESGPGSLEELLSAADD